MKSTLKKFKLSALILSFVEIVLFAVFIVLKETKVFDFEETLTTVQLVSILGFIVLVNLVFLWVGILIFSILKTKNELKAADLIGQDIQEAYNFGMIGLVVTNQEGIVLWVNDLFKERQIDILDSNILDWKPELIKLQEGGANATIKLSVNNRSYEVKFLQDAGLYIFKDITELETITDYSNKQEIVVGQIVIDNYFEITDTGDESEDTLTEVKNVITDYCRENLVLVRKIRNDAFLTICTHESLEKMKKDKFSVLDDVKKIGGKDVVSPTISIGLAYDFPDILKLHDMAASAIEIAMSRGGDQVIISQYGQELVFLGGNTVAQGNKSRVKVRVMADSLFSLIKNSSNVLIMGHTNMDMDALGACLGFKAICDYCKKDAKIIYDPKNTERKTKGALLVSFTKDEISKITCTESEALSSLKSNTLVIVCDVHRPSMTMAPKVVAKANKIAVIDHHRRGEEFVESPVFAIIDTSASSTSEIVAEFMHYTSANPRVNVPATYATIMLSGIFLDSNYFKDSSSGSRTFEASMILKDFGADNGKADDFLKDEFEEYALITKIISTLKTPQFGVVYCVGEETDIIESATLAKVANQCMEMKGINACFVIGRTNSDEVKISCRSDGTVNVQFIAEKLNGGGHFSQAAAAFKKLTISQVETKLLNCLNEYLSDARTVVTEDK